MCARSVVVTTWCSSWASQLPTAAHRSMGRPHQTAGATVSIPVPRRSPSFLVSSAPTDCPVTRLVVRLPTGRALRRQRQQQLRPGCCHLEGGSGGILGPLLRHRLPEQRGPGWELPLRRHQRHPPHCENPPRRCVSVRHNRESLSKAPSTWEETPYGDDR